MHRSTRHTHIRILLLVGLVLAACAPGAHAQREREFTERDLARPQSFGIGAGINFGLYSGDIDEDKEGFGKTELYWRAGGDAVVTWRLGVIADFISMHLRGSAGYHPLRAGSPSYSFVNYVSSTTLGMQLDFFIESPMRLFVHAGGGQMQFRLTVEEHEAGFIQRMGAARGQTTDALVFPVGVGILWYAGRNTDISYQFTKMLTSSDNLDGWVVQERDNFQMISIGLVFYF